MPEMVVHQPMLFVGLGGTGCRVGRELERIMREGLCGPDGGDLRKGRLAGQDYLPYQLPPCLQFVYADLSEAELKKVLPNVVPSAEHHAAAQHTTHLIANLVPPGTPGTPQLLRSMYMNMPPARRAWLPPKDTDPRVAPLTVGAGQLPTAGRAVLHESMRQGGGPSAVLSGILKATQQINAAGAALRALGGRLDNALDVFVAFSVAGGTGCGIFYDYLHMIGHQLHQAQVDARIYPLVLMPSAFEEGMGGGRAAVLNAGSALVDLFRLVDDQNAQGLADLDQEHAPDGDRPLSVHFPHDRHPTVLPPATVQTAFLFGRPSDGVSGDDLIRSMVSLIASLTGAGPEGDLPFVEWFVNEDRSAMAETGIGRRPVSTAAVASLTIPVAELADVISSRLLADAVRDMRAAPVGAAAQNSGHFDSFDVASGLAGFRECAAHHGFQEVGIAPRGYDAVIQALADRAQSMQAAVRANEHTLMAEVSRAAAEFRPTEAAATLSGTVDPFHLRRIAVGDTGYADATDKGGYQARLDERKVPRPTPPGFRFSLNPPQAESVGNRRIRLSALRWTDPEVAQAREDQESWFAWRVEQLWHKAWGANSRVWEPRWRQFVAGVGRLTDAFVDHVGWDAQHFDDRADQLFASRSGVSYLLPADDGGLVAFHARVVAALMAHYQDRLGPNPTSADLVTAILGDDRVGPGDGWRAVYEIGRSNPEDAVEHVRQRLRAAVSERFRPGGGERPLIPAMRELLAAAAGRPATMVDDADVRHFRTMVAGLVPGGYAPAGEGRLRVLVSFPGAEDDREIETFLTSSVLMPRDGIVEFRPNETDSLAVVLYRTGMGITDVPEVRESIRLWSEAQRHARSADRLSWRQRLGRVSHYLVSTAPDRALILQSVLGAMWNGWVDLDGDERSPSRVRIGIGHPDTPPLRLDLTPFGELSSWASLLQAYEEWVLANGDRTNRNLAEQVMRALPRNVDRNPEAPSGTLLALVKMRDLELALVEDVRHRRGVQAGEQIDLFEEFWGETLADALDLPFRGVRAPFANLRGLLEFFGHGVGA